MFESGGFDLQPDDPSRVMAMLAYDSIFVAASLLCDPAIHSEPHELHRIVGNIGRAGTTAFMVPPGKSAYEVAKLRTPIRSSMDPTTGSWRINFEGNYASSWLLRVTNSL